MLPSNHVRVWLTAHLTVPRVLAASLLFFVIFLAISWNDWRLWIADVVLNLALLGFGLIVAYLVGEHWLEQHQQQRWQPVDQVLQHRVLLVTLEILGGFVSAPTIRLALGSQGSAPELPGALSMRDPEVALAFSKQRLTPAISNLPAIARDYTGFMGLGEQDWTAITQGVDRSQDRLARTTILLQDRLSPSLQAALLLLEDRTTGFILFRLPWLEQRSGQGELAYQEASITHARAVLNAANDLLGELIKFGGHPSH